MFKQPKKKNQRKDFTSAHLVIRKEIHITHSELNFQMGLNFGFLSFLFSECLIEMNVDRSVLG